MSPSLRHTGLATMHESTPLHWIKHAGMGGGQHSAGGIEEIFSIALCEHVSWHTLTRSLDHGPIHY